MRLEFKVVMGDFALFVTILRAKTAQIPIHSAPSPFPI